MGRACALCASALMFGVPLPACTHERRPLTTGSWLVAGAPSRPAAIAVQIPRGNPEESQRDANAEEGEPERIPGWRPQPPSRERGGEIWGFEAVPGTGWVPPDAGLAVGLTHIVAIVN